MKKSPKISPKTSELVNALDSFRHYEWRDFLF